MMKDDKEKALQKSAALSLDELEKVNGGFVDSLVSVLNEPEVGFTIVGLGICSGQPCAICQAVIPKTGDEEAFKETLSKHLESHFPELFQK